MKDYIFPMNLQLFADGGAAAGGDGGAAGSGAAAPAAGVQTTGAKNNPLANVIYGKQPQESAPAAGVPTAQPTSQPQTVDRNAEFEAMISGDYKDAFNKRVQDIVQKRLKGHNETEARLNALNPLLDMLGARYGVEASNTEGLVKALQADDSFLEQAAMEHNMDPKAYRELLRVKSENTRLKAQYDQQVLDRQYGVWEQQAAQARNLYPNLDLEVESRNPQFRQLLYAGIDVGTAYKVLHDEELTAAAMQYTAKTVEQKLANNIAAGKNRPAENGTSAQSSVIVKDDPSKWTRAERDAIRRDVARGKKIYL